MELYSPFQSPFHDLFDIQFGRQYYITDQKQQLTPKTTIFYCFLIDNNQDPRNIKMKANLHDSKSIRVLIKTNMQANIVVAVSEESTVRELTIKIANVFSELIKEKQCSSFSKGENWVVSAIKIKEFLISKEEIVGNILNDDDIVQCDLRPEIRIESSNGEEGQTERVISNDDQFSHHCNRQIDEKRYYREKIRNEKKKIKRKQKKKQKKLRKKLQKQKMNKQSSKSYPFFTFENAIASGRKEKIEEDEDGILYEYITSQMSQQQGCKTEETFSFHHNNYIPSISEVVEEKVQDDYYTVPTPKSQKNRVITKGRFNDKFDEQVKEEIGNEKRKSLRKSPKKSKLQENKTIH